MPAFVNDTRSNSPAAARHPPHLANDLIDLRYDINSEGGFVTATGVGMKGVKANRISLCGNGI